LKTAGIYVIWTTTQRSYHATRTALINISDLCRFKLK